MRGRRCRVPGRGCSHAGQPARSIERYPRSGSSARRTSEIACRGPGFAPRGAVVSSNAPPPPHRRSPPQQLAAHSRTRRPAVPPSTRAFMRISSASATSATPVFGEFGRPSAPWVGDPGVHTASARSRPYSRPRGRLRRCRRRLSPVCARRPRRDHARTQRSGWRRRQHLAAAIVSTQRPSRVPRSLWRPDGAGSPSPSSLGPIGNASIHKGLCRISNLATPTQRVSATSPRGPIRGCVRTPQGQAGGVGRARTHTDGPANLVERAFRR
jgi:hypothetical protein